MKRSHRLGLALLLLVPALAGLSAFLPLWYDIPKRGNPHDYVNRRGADKLNPPLPTPTAVVPERARWDFDDGTTQGWAIGTEGTGFTSVASSSTRAHDGSYSLEIHAALTSGSAATMSGYVEIGTGISGVDFTGQTLTAWVWVPAGMSDSTNPCGATLYVQDTSWNWANNTWKNLPSGGGWTRLTFDLSTATGCNLHSLKYLGVKVSLGSSSPNWSGTVFVDTVNYPGAFPTATPTATRSPLVTASATATASPVVSATVTRTQAVGTATATATITPTGSSTALASPSPAFTAGGVCGHASDTAWEGFESGVDGFTTYGGPSVSFGALAAVGSPWCNGAASLCDTVTINSAAGQSFTIGKAFAAPRNLSGGTLSVMVYSPATVPAGSTAKMYAKTSATGDWNAMADVSLPTTAGWTKLTWNLASVAAVTETVEVGVNFWINAGTSGASYLLCMDSFDIAGLGSPTASPSPTGTATPTASATPSATGTPSASPSPTASPTATDTHTEVPAGSSATDTPTVSPTFSASPTATASPTASSTASASPTVSPSGTPTDSPTPSPTASPSATASPTPSPANAVWNFDTGTTQDWQADTSYDLGFTSVAVSTAQVHDGVGSLQGVAAFTTFTAKGTMQIKVNSSPLGPLDMSGKTLTAWLYVPSGLTSTAYAQLFAACGSGWSWVTGASVPLTTTGWIKLTDDLSLTNTAGTVNAVGVQVGGMDTFTGSFYLDSVNY